MHGLFEDIKLFWGAKLVIVTLLV